METRFDGERNKRGDWTPPEPLQYAPILEWPPRPLAFLKWVFGYPGFFLPWGLFYMAVPALTWRYLTPSLETMKTFAPGWIAFITLRNLVLIMVWTGIWHVWFYVKQA